MLRQTALTGLKIIFFVKCYIWLDHVFQLSVKNSLKIKAHIHFLLNVNLIEILVTLRKNLIRAIWFFFIFNLLLHIINELVIYLIIITDYQTN